MVGGMVASEFCVGNFVEVYGKITKVNMVGEFGLQTKYLETFSKIKFTNPALKPIPLSEEILIKAGFVKMFETEYTINTYQLGFIKLWDKKGDFSQLFIQLHEYIEIKHLHTLQNFYYLLSNCKELEIEL